MVASKKYGDYASFLKNKEKLANVIQTAILAMLAKMGEDIKGITWFSSQADDYCAAKQKKAA